MMVHSLCLTQRLHKFLIVFVPHLFTIIFKSAISIKEAQAPPRLSNLQLKMEDYHSWEWTYTQIECIQINAMVGSPEPFNYSLVQ